MKIFWLILLIIFILCILLNSWEFSIEEKFTIKKTGIIWVLLDRWSIWKYKSDDKPMKIIEYENYRKTK